MESVKKIAHFMANYFAFVGGLLFIFTLGVIYAFIKPQGILINGIFLLLGLGWVGFLIKYFWDIVEKNEIRGKSNDDVMEIHIKHSSETSVKNSNEPTTNV